MFDTKVTAAGDNLGADDNLCGSHSQVNDDFDVVRGAAEKRF
jgi:hypothetical protein